jgi:hypothetical protein
MKKIIRSIVLIAGAVFFLQATKAQSAMGTDSTTHKPAKHKSTKPVNTNGTGTGTATPSGAAVPSTSASPEPIPNPPASTGAGVGTKNSDSIPH